jgi:hypothetical protein
MSESSPETSPTERATQRARIVKDRVTDELRRYPNVVGVGVGYKLVGGRPTSTVAVRVYVREKVPEAQLDRAARLPKDIEGVPVDVVEGEFRLLDTPTSLAEHRRRRPILYGGISVGNLRGSGTLGVSAFDSQQGHQVLL